MPISIKTPALIARQDVLNPTANDGLKWQPITPTEGKAALPRFRGVYIWVAREEPEPVLYIGCATGSNGLWTRLGNELGWVAQASQPDLRQQYEFSGHARTLADRDGFAYFAVCDEEGAAKMWEKRLLHHSLRLTGSVPIVNGGGWWNTSDDAEAAREWSRQTLCRPMVP